MAVRRPTLLDLVAMALYGTGLAAAGAFWTNTRIIGVRESDIKEPVIAANVAVWPVAGIADLLLGGGPGRFAASLLLPGSRRWAWRAFFTLLGARYLSQQVSANRNPRTRPTQVLDTTVRDFDFHADVARAEHRRVSGLKGILWKRNEIYNLQVTRHDMAVENLSPNFDGFTLAQISDIHYGRFTSDTYVRRCVETALSLEPDLIALTGDFQHYARDRRRAAELLRPVGEWSHRERGGHGAYAVLGNHDTWNDTAAVTQALRDSGIEVLNNRHVVLKRGEASLYLAGVADMWSLRADLDLALHGIPAGAPVVLLSHVPDMLPESAESGVALQLSGHLHGGQITLPFVGAMLSPSRYNRRYVAGFYERGRTLLYTCRGLGGHPPIRLGCKPEIAVFVLRARPGRDN